MRADEEGRKAGKTAVENVSVVDLEALMNLEDIQGGMGRPRLNAEGEQDGLLMKFAKKHLNSNASLLLEAVPAFQPSSFGTIVRLLIESRTISKNVRKSTMQELRLGFRQPSFALPDTNG